MLAAMADGSFGPRNSVSLRSRKRAISLSRVRVRVLEQRSREHAVCDCRVGKSMQGQTAVECGGLASNLKLV